MRFRWFHLALILFETFFLNVVIPGHQRGIVQLPGANTQSASSCPFCCCESTAQNHPNKSHSNDPPKHPETCAICAFAAHLTIPPVFDCTPEALKLLCPVINDVAHSPATCHVILPFDERGPPTIA